MDEPRAHQLYMIFWAEFVDKINTCLGTKCKHVLCVYLFYDLDACPGIKFILCIDLWSLPWVASLIIPNIVKHLHWAYYSQ